MDIQRATDGPIPGQSLTREPGSAPWERPPLHTDPDKVIRMFFERLTDEDHAIQLCGMLDAGIPVPTIVMSLLLQGFSEGKWTPDVAIVVAPVLGAIITKIGMLAGIENIVTGEKKTDVSGVLAQLAAAKKRPGGVDPEQAVEAVDEAKQEFDSGEFKPATGGLMGMKAE